MGIFSDSDLEFKREVLSSELLSRGWVYQEVILAPANLFCTARQMWWLCHTGRYHQDRMTKSRAETPDSGSGWPFEAATLSRGRKAIANPSGAPGSLRLWGDLLQLYIKTSVTFEDDRLAEIAGLSKVFQSVFPRCVEHDCYNSGFWSTNIVFQLSWHTISSEVALHGYTADFYIPSWSPVSCKSEIFYTIDDEPYQLPIKWAMNTSGLDSFGSGKSIEQCILHLRGVPIEMTLSPVENATKVKHEVWPLSHPDLTFQIQWDNQAEFDLAEKGSLKNGLSALILIAAELHLGMSLEGLLLRPFTNDDLTTTDNLKWVRCGYLQKRGPNDRYREICEAFQLARYGITWVKDKNGFLERVSTGTTPDLEDIYLV